MPFHERNCFYLRISATNVIPLYLYLDERHIEWMTDKTLQHVISDLRPLLSPKLQAEANAHLGPGGPANAKKATVDVHRGDNYQFAYFLRKSDPHSVVLKTREFVMVPPKPKPLDKQSKSKKRKGSADVSASAAKAKRPRKGKNKSRVGRSDVASREEEDIDDHSTSSDDETISYNTQPRRSDRSKGKARANYRVDSDDEDSNFPDSVDEPGSNIEQQNPVAVKVEEPDEAISGSSRPDERISQAEEGPVSTIDLVDDEEEKIKPVLKLQYKGFSIYGRCLCVVVEPYPPMRSSTRAPSAAPQRPRPRTSSIAPPDYEAAFDDRASVPPLFLPDFDKERSTSVTPARTLTRRATSPLFAFGEEEEDEDGFGMMAFSQVLNSVSGEGKGGIDEDDDIDESVFEN